MTPEINLKVLSGGKVILADCLGYESELFVPVVINNRIVLQNTVPLRRCCKQDSFGNSFGKNDSSIPRQVPLANSTPARILKSKENIRSSINAYSRPIKLTNSLEMNLQPDVTIKPLSQSQNTKVHNKIARIIPTTSANAPQFFNDTNNTMNRFPTPDIVRRAAIHNANETIPVPQSSQLTELKIVRLHRAYTPNTPKNPAKVLRSKKSSSPQVLRNLQNLSSFGSPPSLNRTNKMNAVGFTSPNQSFLTSTIKTPGTVTKWRKCITPKRTYIRRSNGQKPPSKTTYLQPLQLAKNGKFVESYRFPIETKSQFIFRRRKLIIDDSVKITPRKFKKQLTNTTDLNREQYNLPKSRKSFHLSHITAFDLLTNSSFHPKIGRALNAVFRQGCVNKCAATILKYKQLINDIPSAEL